MGNPIESYWVSPIRQYDLAEQVVEKCFGNYINWRLFGRDKSFLYGQEFSSCSVVHNTNHQGDGRQSGRTRLMEVGEVGIYGTYECMEQDTIKEREK
jgi:hypothetical protein